MPARPKQVSGKAAARRAAAAPSSVEHQMLQYIHDTPESTWTPQAQLRHAKRIMAGFDAAATVDPAADVEALRARVVARGGSAAAMFTRLFPMVFARITCRARTPEEAASLETTRAGVLELMHKRAEAEVNRVPEKQAAAAALRSTLGLAVTEPVHDEAGTVQPTTAAAMFGEQCRVRQPLG